MSARHDLRLPTRLLGNGALLTVAGAALVAAAFTVLSLVLHLEGLRAYEVELGYATPDALVPPLTSPDVELSYTTVLMRSTSLTEPTGITQARLLETTALGSRHAVALLGFLVLAVLCWRLTRPHPFGRWLAVAVGLVSALLGAVALVGPWLLRRAHTLAVQASGLPGPPQGNEVRPDGWVSAQPWRLGDTDVTLLVLAVAVGLGALALLKAARLQSETAGLI